MIIAFELQVRTEDSSRDEIMSLPAHPAPMVAVEIQVDPTVNYAVQQNDVTVVKRLKITNWME